MDTDLIRRARVKAEAAVADMKDKGLREKAFEVILNRLLQGHDVQQVDLIPNRVKSASQVTKLEKTPSSLPARILTLKAADFFVAQRTMREIRDELAVHGWHYPNTALSGALQTLVQHRDLRRLRGTAGKKQVWKYSNP